MKKLAILIVLCAVILAGWLNFKTPSLIEEGKNIFDSSIYSHYHLKIRQFITHHPAYENIKEWPATAYNIQVKTFIDEINKLPDTPQEQRTHHETFTKKMREIILFSQNFSEEEKDSRRLFEEMIQWLFLEIDLKPEMQDFLYGYVNPPNENLLTYLEKTRTNLHAHPHFDGIKRESSYEDQFMQGNLPSFVAIINNRTKLIRLGQPICQSSRTLWWYLSPQISPEFLLFLKQQPRHFYVNLMKRKGVEGSLTHALETLEDRLDNFYAITLDKNSTFYWQEDKDYPEIIESRDFKQLFLDKMCSANGTYFWSKHLDSLIWKEELQDIIHQVHQSLFHHQELLNRKERQDFIEMTYLTILDHLIDKWSPTSMNITCRQGMDRGPSLMVLWMLQKMELEKGEIAALLLAPPLMIHNRTSHASRIERFISAAKRFKTTQTKSSSY